MDPSVRIGDLMGPEVCLEQWRIYTAAHVSYRSQVRSIRVLGSEESPVDLVELSVFARWSRDTFRLMFPHAISYESLVNRFIGKEFEYTAVNQYHFTPDGWISILQVGIDIVGSLVRCGVRISDIAMLMTATTLTPHCTVQSS
ncbi:hypothetical protein Poli38472_014412 [Pythium oligandrum]|uniref:Uncharacterized protein n=1 Tax=Pythium oligandrum TaxID=41045 RepID=A0A8K1FEC3_PYTOL|nr:hypothetical protein Poli38472_014412 [Pythium oligandrum]|eukprot:TMW57809.1 hypothetical protein Poli38472_014412 [Pythium oligandrum]